MELFGTDGIRGSVGTWPLTPEFFLKLGRYAGLVFKHHGSNPLIVVGRDTRESGVMLQSALVSGFVASGVGVMDVGVVPTPGVAWIVGKVGAAAGAVISASHNPFEQNGIKFFSAGGKKIPAHIEEEIEKLLSNEENDLSHNGSMGRVIDGSIHTHFYLQSLLNEHPAGFLVNQKIVLDCANGAASHLAPHLFTQAGAVVSTINASPTGENINVNAGSEYVRGNPKKFGTIISHFGADLGIAFDGDADRVIFVDEKGNLVDGDHILGFLAVQFRSKNALLGNTVVTTQMRNEGLHRFVKSNGIDMVETPVGDKYVVEALEKIRNTHGDPVSLGLGGEQSGHIIIMDEDHHTGDGMRTALHVLNVFASSGTKIFSDLAGLIKKTPQVITSAEVAVGGPRFDKTTLHQKSENLKAQFPDLLRINLRYSGTEPKFRLMLEGDTSLSVHDLAQISQAISLEVQDFSGIKQGRIEIMNCTFGGLIESPLRSKDEAHHD